MRILLCIEKCLVALTVVSVSTCNQGQLIIRPNSNCYPILVDGIRNIKDMLKHLNQYGFLDLSEYTAYYYDENMYHQSESDDMTRNINLYDTTEEDIDLDLNR